MLYCWCYWRDIYRRHVKISRLYNRYQRAVSLEVLHWGVLLWTYTSLGLCLDLTMYTILAHDPRISPLHFSNYKACCPNLATFSIHDASLHYTAVAPPIFRHDHSHPPAAVATRPYRSPAVKIADISSHKNAHDKHHALIPECPGMPRNPNLDMS